MPSQAVAAGVARLLDARAIDMAFQPIVQVETGTAVGYEALARPPEGISPVDLLAAARQLGREEELDWICRAAALRGALAANLPPDLALFVNVEPRALGSPCPPDLTHVVAAADLRLNIVLEVTERRLADDPASLLAAIDHARTNRMGLALDDVGADPASLAMMSLICPDVIKLDLSLIHGRPTAAVARIVNAVQAEAERTGAAILAEGIESPRHVNMARAMGATFGQGWFYGRPGPLPRHPATEPAERGSATISRVAFGSAGVSTPFDAVADRPTVRATAQVLLPMSRHLEYKGLDAIEPTVLLASFQDRSRFGPRAERRYRRLAARGVLTAVVGKNMPPEPAPGVRGASVAPDDPILHEWSVIVLGPHFAAALLARECSSSTQALHSPAEREFEAVVTHNRDVVITAARPLISRLNSLRPI